MLREQAQLSQGFCPYLTASLKPCPSCPGSPNLPPLQGRAPHRAVFPLDTVEQLLWKYSSHHVAITSGGGRSSLALGNGDTVILSQEEDTSLLASLCPHMASEQQEQHQVAEIPECCGTLSLNLPRSKLTGDEGFSAITSFFHLSPSQMGPDPAGPHQVWTEGIHMEVCPFSDTGGPHLIGIKGRAATLS